MLMHKGSTNISFSERLKDAIKEKKHNKDTLLVLDCSGSMAELYDGKSKYSYLQNAVVGMNNRKLYFNSSISFSGLTPRGGTDLASALNAIPADVERAIVVSDGLPDSEASAIQAAKTRGIPLDIIFIGDDPRGRAFMDMLASITGGRSSAMQVEEIYKLKSQILMLKGQ